MASTYSRCRNVLCFKNVYSFTCGERSAVSHLNRVNINNCRPFVTQLSPKAKAWGKNALIVGGAFFVGISYYSVSKSTENKFIVQKERFLRDDPTIVSNLPDIKPSRSIISPTDSTGLKLTLFQYPTCPFCCKVRAFLDYYGFSYDVVEVDPVLRQQIIWSEYKKVPILLVKRDDGSYIQLNDSTLIVSMLKSFLLDQSEKLEQLHKYYPIFEYNEKGKKKVEVPNRYFVMYKESQYGDRIKEEIMHEIKWRKWADESLVHVLSPNVYRSREEAIQSFQWFSEVGEWDRLFPSWEKNLIVYVGAYAMWMIGKRLKKRHNLKEDVRQSLYDELRTWMKTVRASNGKYCGGAAPNMADLAVYGVLSSIEGCEAFKDALENTSIGTWYFKMREVVTNRTGSALVGAQ